MAVRNCAPFQIENAKNEFCDHKKDVKNMQANYHLKNKNKFGNIFPTTLYFSKWPKVDSGGQNLNLPPNFTNFFREIFHRCQWNKVLGMWRRCQTL